MKLSEWQMFDTTKVNKSGRRVILYLFAEIKGHNCYYSVCMKYAKNSNILCYLTIRLARHLCSSTPLVYMYVCMDGTYALLTRARGTFFS